ncbi:MAG TPA: response regulator [Gammaproteobacteria bacterium]|nr:response regulator [Gammaproteobacteria bacterium]
MTFSVRDLPDFSGLRVLIVEDEMMLALTLEDMLKLMGCDVIKVARLAPALKLAEAEEIGIALLDLNLAGERSYPVADTLKGRDIPFAFMTGYHVDDLRPEWRDRPILQKPFLMAELVRVIKAVSGR